MKLLSGLSGKKRLLLSAAGPLFLLYLFCIVRFHTRFELQVQTCSPLNIAVLLSGFLSLFLLSSIVDIVTGRRGLLKAALNSMFILLYLVLSTYHMRTHTLLDYAVIADNAALAFYRESLQLITQDLKRDDYILAGAVAAIVALMQWRWRILTAPRSNGRRPWTKLLLLLSGYVLLLNYLPYTYDEIASFGQSAYRYYIAPEHKLRVSDPHVRFPYVREIVNKKKAAPPHIFIVMVESFNANFVNARTPEGVEYTPFFNSLTRQGVYFDNFWGNSIQTAKGQLSILCSVIPLTRHKVFTHYPGLNLRCLPDIMKTNGYETVFLQGFSSLAFDNTGVFMKKNGFSHVLAMDGSLVSEDERLRYGWSWGIQDDILYRKTFGYLDEVNGNLPATAARPAFFTVVMTASNHTRFNHVPESQRYIYPAQKNKKQYYANSIRATDEYLKTFFQELRNRDYLRNSVVIITGDHSFPVGEHGYYDNESASYNEYFRTPLLIWGKDIAPRVVHGQHSQLDIAPTVLDLAGISAPAHFRGDSVFSGAPLFIPLVQPYAGNNIAVLSYPYKYVYNKRAQKEYLFDLLNDPSEKENIIDQIYSKPLYKAFRNQAGEVLLNDRLVRENRIWDPGRER